MKKYPSTNIVLAKRLMTLSYILTAIAFLSVGLMRRIKFNVDIDFSFIPSVNAIINTCVAICLLAGYYFIRKGEFIKHRFFMIVAVSLSAVFFILYILYHFTTPETVFCKEGTIRIMYYFVLLTHIVLAGLSLPFILFTFVRGFTFQVDKHRKMARWVFPIWLYVAVTGPITFIMLKSCYL